VRWLSDNTGQRYRLLTADEWLYVAGAGERTPRRYGPMVSGLERFYEWVEDCQPHEGECSWRYLYRRVGDSAGGFSHPPDAGELDFEFRVARDYPGVER
jgi:formylglycine-generating enzyme required for sulfatase activity